MTTGDKAKRTTVAIGGQEVDGFQMPDGSYRMSITSAAAAIGTSQQNATNFLRSKALKALQSSGYTSQTSEKIEVESADQVRGQARITALPLDIAFAFWLYQCSRGNKQAYNLIAALGLETLERRFDLAFGVERSEAERNTLLAQRLQQTEAQLEVLGEAYAEPELLREENERLMYVCLSPDDVLFGIPEHPEALPEVGNEVHGMPGWIASTVREFEPSASSTYDQVLVFWCAAAVLDRPHPIAA